MSRQYTNKLFEYLDDGLLTNEMVITACLKYMSEDDVKDMMQCNDFILEEVHYNENV
jgi:hypothetical protein